MNHLIRVFLISLLTGIPPTNVLAVDLATGISLELRTITKTYNTGTVAQPVSTPVNLWVYCLSGLATPGGCDATPELSFPGPLLEIAAGGVQTVLHRLVSTPTVGLTPLESTAVAHFRGHTLHVANLNLPAAQDGVPAPFPPDGSATNNTADKTYTIDLSAPNSLHVGSHAYYCHVHQTKHLEMGEFGAFIVRPSDMNGFINNIGLGNNPALDYQVEAIFVVSTIDPRYHATTAVGDNSVFATYDPSIFLVSGAQGLTPSSPAVTISATINQKVAIRLIGMHSVNATFQIVDNVTVDATTGIQLGTSQPFDLHIIDGRQQSTPQVNIRRVELSPGQTKDILVNMPPAATTWYPVVTYKPLWSDEINDELGNVISIIDITP